jgi:predicted ester cyclase
MDARDLVRMIVEECWSDAAGLDRMEEHLAAGYVHHTAAFGDWDFAGFKRGLEWVDGQFADRAYSVEHVIVEGELAAAYLLWSATRRADGATVTGKGAYHCRIADGLIREDWDLFYPMS